MNYLQIATSFLETRLKGKYITLDAITPILKSFENVFEVTSAGKSVEGRVIYKVKIGNGPTKILMWSQMHGNEPTTTKGLFDFFNFLAVESELAKKIKAQYTFVCLPMLNPDGAFYYTRENANKVDLNRDALNVSQLEMKVLHEVYGSFQPDYCYNLHDQRTIFGTDNYNLPATLSFLAPAFNEERDFNDVRMKAIVKINLMNKVLQEFIPGQVGRFDDSYNVNCTGDFFTTQNTPTILFEAGHFQEDYQREESRKYVFISLLSSVSVSNENVIVDNELQEYLHIPQNNKRFFDLIYKNVKIINNSVEKIINFAAQFEEVLIHNEIQFVARISKVEDLEGFFGHLEFDCKEMLFSAEGSNFPEIGKKADFLLNNSIEYRNGVNII